MAFLDATQAVKDRPRYDHRSEVGVDTDGEVELRGILDTISNRFWNGWGYGTLSTDRGVVKITGTLEGHIAGTSLVVRGVYKNSPYGRQLDCSSIIVDVVSGQLNVICAWARKNAKEHEDALLRALRHVPIDARWVRLTEAAWLEKQGFETDAARFIATEAAYYLKFIETKKGLMEQGFTDHEAEALCARYRETVLELFECDPYLFVLERVVGFSRVDTVVNGRVWRTDVRRLHAAVVQALASAQKNGHTAASPRGVQKEAAQLAGVYLDALEEVGFPQRQVVAFEGLWQLRTTAWAEQDIAAWIGEAMKKG